MRRASWAAAIALGAAAAMGAAASELDAEFLDFLGSFADEDGNWLDPLELEELELPEDGQNEDGSEDEDDDQGT